MQIETVASLQQLARARVGEPRLKRQQGIGTLQEQVLHARAVARREQHLQRMAHSLHGRCLRIKIHRPHP